MSAGAAERHLQPSERPEHLKRAGRRLKLTEVEVEAAKKQFNALYVEFLRTDPEFIAKSEAAERWLAQGPPWDEAFSPSELLKAVGAIADCE